MIFSGQKQITDSSLFMVDTTCRAMVENESLLRHGLFLRGKENSGAVKKLLTAGIDLSMLSVLLQRRFYPAAALVFENRIAVCVVIAVIILSVRDFEFVYSNFQ